jgi:S1-C subfamily serine protease
MRRVVRSIFVLCCVVLAPLSSGAGVAADVLPSLSPMLSRVSPAVVNISGTGTTSIADNPLYRDPYFRRFFDLPDVPNERETKSAVRAADLGSCRSSARTSPRRWRSFHAGGR